MSIQKISKEQLRRMGNQEGLILQGCGGDPQEWLDGINQILTDEGILKKGTRFEEAYTFQHDGVTCLLFPFKEGMAIEMGRLAMWRLQTHPHFGGTWLSDYVPNRLGGFLQEQEQGIVKPDCPLIPIRLQVRMSGYSQRPSVTKCRVRLQVPDLLLVLYCLFPLFPKPPVFVMETGGFDILERLFFVYSVIFLTLLLPGQDRLTHTISNQLTITSGIVREQRFKHIIEFSTGKPWQMKLLSVHPLHGSNLPVESRMKGASLRIRD